MPMTTVAEERVTAGTQSRRWRIVTVVGLQVLLGLPAMVPLVAALLCLQNWPLASLGITERATDEWDGVLLLAVPLVTCSSLVWLTIAFVLRRYVWPIGARGFWRASSLAVVFPTAVFVVAPVVIRAWRSLT